MCAACQFVYASVCMSVKVCECVFLCVCDFVSETVRGYACVRISLCEREERSKVRHCMVDMYGRDRLTGRMTDM